MKLKRFTGDEVRELRRKCVMNQSECRRRSNIDQMYRLNFDQGR